MGGKQAIRVALLLAGTLLGLWSGSLQWARSAEAPVRRVHAPYRPGGIDWAETAIFWFGRVNAAENYVDGRVAYNDQILLVHLIVFDRQLWYDRSPTPETLLEWDAAELFLATQATPGSAPGPTAHRFVVQLHHWQDPMRYRAAYQGNGTTWVARSAVYTATAGHRAGEINGPGEDRGWLATFRIPFRSLGMDGPPPPGTVWRLGVRVHDRDGPEEPVPYTPAWPETFRPDNPTTWGELVFGMPQYTPPPAVPQGTTLIRQGVAGTRVVDAQVGGDTVCGGNLDYWTEWGNANYAGSPHLNVQNQNDVADWPCFSKVYMTFPLDAIPPGKRILSATVTLHQFGNAYGQGVRASWVQVLTVAEDWDESTITWNNAPWAEKNLGGTWVEPVDRFPGWPGIPWTWDVSLAVAEAYREGRPLRLAFYSADTAYHSGKYFVSSDTGDWNAQARPTLRVGWGQPLDPAAMRYRLFLPHLFRGP